MVPKNKNTSHNIFRFLFLFSDELKSLASFSIIEVRYDTIFTRNSSRGRDRADRKTEITMMNSGK